MDQKTRIKAIATLRKTADKIDPPRRRRKVKAAEEGLDPRKAMLYFDIHLEDYNVEEDQDSDDEDAKERLAEFLELGGGDLSRAAQKAEDMMVKEMQKRLAKAGLRVRLSNEGHGSGDELVMKFGIDDLDQVEKVIEFVGENMGGGDDVIYSEDVAYMEARGFTLYPQGVNGLRVEFDGMEDWLDDQKAAVSGSARKVSAAKLTRQHFIAMADAIAKLSNADDRKMMLDALAPMLLASNPNFDMARFSKAAKVAVEGSARSPRAALTDDF